MAIGIVFILDRSTLALANHNVSTDLRLSPIQMGMLLSAFSWAYAFSQLPMGVLVDFTGGRVVLGAGAVIWACTQALTGSVSSLSQFVTARVLLGLGEAPIYPAGAKIIATWFNKRERGAPTGLFLASTTIGPVLAPPIITALLVTLGWRKMYVALGILGIIISFTWFLFAPRRTDLNLGATDDAYFEEDALRHNPAFGFGRFGTLFAQRSTWGLILGFVGIIYMVWLYLTWLPFYLEQERHFSIRRVGWMLSLPYIFGTVGNVLSGYLADGLLKRGFSAINSRKYPICIGLLGSAAFTVPMAYTPDARVAIFYLCCVMFFLYIASAGAWALLSVVAPRSMIATVGSLQNFAGYFGGSFAPVITGFLLENTQSFKAAFVTSAIIAIASAFFYFVLVREPIVDTIPSVGATI
jgi:sugar phosphate permease